MSSEPQPATAASLRAALEAVYTAFEVQTPPEIEGCPCCISEREIEVLLTKQLRQLSGGELWAYVSGAFLTIGCERDFRYLLPRILEIAISDPSNSNDPEIVLSKFGLADWQSWSLSECEVIENYVDAWFEYALAQDTAEAADGLVGCEAESVLCGAARSDFSLHRWLQRLQEPTATPVLADLKKRSPKELSAFWEYAPSGLDELCAILL